MYNERLKAMLHQSADMLHELAERIGDTGRPLTQRERVMARCAMLPAVQEICDGIILNHIQGIAQDADHLSNELSALEVQ